MDEKDLSIPTKTESTWGDAVKVSLVILLCWIPIFLWVYDFYNRPQKNYTKGQFNKFHNYVCSDDCSGHIAGYNWAAENYIDDENDCKETSQSFMEGCLAYVHGE